MKLTMAILAYGMIALILCGGILMVMAGKPWLLVAALLAYVIAFSKIGCLSH